MLQLTTAQLLIQIAQQLQATESGESTATGDMAHTAVYAVLAMVAAGLALAVVVYDNKKREYNITGK